MSKYLVPVERPQPDAQEFLRIVKGEQVPRRVPLIEYIVDETLLRPIVTDMLGREWSTEPSAYWDNVIQFWYRMGYDMVHVELGLPFDRRLLSTADTSPGVARDRAWADEHHGAIASWEDFERYPWPRVEAFDFGSLEYLATHLPEGMGFITAHGGGPFEWLSWIMSYEGLALTLHDDLALVRAVAERIGGLMEQFYRHLLELPNVIALWPGDDMGFRTGTLISPDHLRELTLPWHRRFAAMAHQRGVLYFLHSCGDLGEIMEDLVRDVGIDAKHSFEDAILPVTAAYARYADRIALLGGVDVDMLARADEGRLRAYVRGILEQCAPGGRFALGSGNSIPSYIPLDSYLVMLDEGLRWAG